MNEGGGGGVRIQERAGRHSHDGGLRQHRQSVRTIGVVARRLGSLSLRLVPVQKDDGDVCP